jgi:hypothetical protein
MQNNITSQVSMMCGQLPPLRAVGQPKLASVGVPKRAYLTYALVRFRSCRRLLRERVGEKTSR